MTNTEFCEKVYEYLRFKIVKIYNLIVFSTKIIFRRGDTVFLFCSPYHPNMGDHAQTYCIQKWYQKNYPSYRMIILQSTVCRSFIFKIIRKTIKRNDKLVCHSGYHLTNIYNEQRVYFYLIENFKDFQIIIFPQTINYTTAESLEYAKRILNSHPNLTLMCRDEVSYNTAKLHFTNAKLLLYPDIVTSLIGTKTYRNDRDGVLFCMRNDEESYYKPNQIEEVRKLFIDIKTSITDTDRFDFSMNYLYKHREQALETVWDEFSRYKVIITDRYHGTIFSLITCTPVIVIGSSDHKLSSGVKWFPKDVFNGYVSFANNLDEAFIKAKEVLEKSDTYKHKLPAYFKINYYDKLKDIVI